MCEKCEYQKYLDDIFEMESSEDYEFAFETLDGIGSWVKENKHITDKQKEAIENIYISKK